ncbi:unnamed protein product [Xylocopa violacea]
MVTGAASGIGKAIATELLKRKVNVLALDTNCAKLSAASDEWKRLERYGKFCIKRCDVTNEQDLEEAFSFVAKEWDGLHILVNSAGVFSTARIIDSDREALERLLNVNVLGTTLCVVRGVRLMRERDVEGHIFNINSMAGHHVPYKNFSEKDKYSGSSLYPASKFASVALTESVRRELAAIKARIRITSVCPGLVNTDMIHPSELSGDVKTHPHLEPEDVANAVMYALSTRPEVQISEMKIQHTNEVYEVSNSRVDNSC